MSWVTQVSIRCSICSREKASAIRYLPRSSTPNRRCQEDTEHGPRPSSPLTSPGVLSRFRQVNEREIAPIAILFDQRGASKRTTYVCHSLIVFPNLPSTHLSQSLHASHRPSQYPRVAAFRTFSQSPSRTHTNAGSRSPLVVGSMHLRSSLEDPIQDHGRGGGLSLSQGHAATAL